MIFRIYASKDTQITNSQKNRVMMTGSNMGASEVLDLFKKCGISGAIGVASSSSLSRLLLQFDLSKFNQVSASIGIPSALTYYLKMRHATSADTLPASFDVTIHPLTSPWDEGRGIDVEFFSDSGYANWVKPRADLTWTSGSSFSTIYSASYHFDTGYEDLDVDVSSVVNTWQQSVLSNYGVVVKLTASIESDSVYTDYYVKSFYGRESTYKDRRPYIEARWDDSVRDDRSTMLWNQSGTLYMYNKVGGQLTNLPYTTFTVSIADSSGTIKTVSGSYTGITGIYSASFALSTGSNYSGSVFYDRWASAGNSYMTGTFYLSSAAPVDNNEQETFTMNIKNLKDEYDVSENPRLNIFARTRKYRPQVVQTSSLDTKPYILRKAYYAIENDSTRERVVQFGTGTIETTRLSYDKNGNYFNFYMSSLQSGNVYRILFLVDQDGQQQVIDDGFKFKVI